MLSISRTNVAETLALFKQRGIRVGFIVPTQTGLNKSILDAHESLRAFFKANEVHDYQAQYQGSENKRLIPTLLVSGDETIETQTSLYRPITKSGDPRLWIYKLSNYAREGDLLAIAPSDKGLLVVNCSNSNLHALLAPTHDLLGQLFPSRDTFISPTAAELLDKLEGIARRGYLRTLRKGDTGVGYTLETFLGIDANSSKKPDYKGIEIKAGRAGGASKQATVFAQVPNWKASELKGSKALLAKHGRHNEKKNRKQLFHEISCSKPNSYGLQLLLSDSWEQLYQIYWRQNDTAESLLEKDVVWFMDSLMSRIDEKHTNTVWVTAQVRGRGENESFWYNKVNYTTGVDSSALPILLESGQMTVHYTISETSSGGVKDQGYLFKMSAKYLPTLFRQSRVIEFD